MHVNPESNRNVPNSLGLGVMRISFCLNFSLIREAHPYVAGGRNRRPGSTSMEDSSNTFHSPHYDPLTPMSTSAYTTHLHLALSLTLSLPVLPASPLRRRT